MSKILLVDIDSRIPNLALYKLKTYHEQQGDTVAWTKHRDMFQELDVDKIYVSCVFVANKPETAEWEGLATIGGSGYDLSVALPPEIEAIKPRINWGFTTRGCIRKCGFCIVPEKEGGIHVVGDLLDLWDGGIERKVTVLDNNILALPEHFQFICQQARDNKLQVDFNQGLDHRLLTPEIIVDMVSIRHTEYRFAYDRALYERTVVDALKLLKKNNLRCFWYVLVGYDTEFEEDIYRLNLLREWGQTVFVQRYIKTRGNLTLSRWANQHAIFPRMTFQQFLELPRTVAYRRKYSEVDAYLAGGGK